MALTPGIAAHDGRLLFFAGDHDHAVPNADREQIIGALRAAGGRHEVVVYPGRTHGFFCDARDTFDEEAAGDAWQRVRRLLDDELLSAER